MTDSVITIVCCYRLSPDAVRGYLDRLAQKSGVTLSGVIVDNRVGAKPAVAGRWRVVPGSNALMDMSAYREGAALLMSLPAEPSRVLFLNDTTFTEHDAAAIIDRLLRYRDFVGNLDIPAIVGKVDRYSSVCFANPWSGLNAYVSSYAFLLNARALPLLVRAYDEIDTDMGDGAIDIVDPAWASQLHQGFRAYLRLHLTTDYDPLSWYRLRRSPVEAATLRKKARCVYLEHRLSGSVGDEGVILSLYPRQRDKLVYLFMERIARVRRRLGRMG